MNTYSLFVGALSHVRLARRLCLGAVFLAAVASDNTVSAQTNNTWASGTTGGAWTTPGLWTVNEVPGSNTGDTATLGNVTGTSATRSVTLNANETIAGLTFTQTTAGNTNLLDIQGGGTSSVTLTNTSTLALNATAGTAELYLDNTASGNGDAQYNGNITVGTNGILEMSSFTNGTTTKTSNITGNVTIASGGNFNVELPVSTGAFDGSFVNGNITLQSGGTLTLGKTTAANGTATLAGTNVRFAETSGAFVANTGSVLNAPGAVAVTNVLSLQFGGTTTSATFDSGVTGSFFTPTNGATTIVYNGTQSSPTGASVFTLDSDVALPQVAISPTTTTNNLVNVTIGTVAATTLQVASLSLTPGFSGAAGATKETGSLEVTLGSNVSLGSGSNVTFNTVAGSTIVLNLGGFTLNQSGHNFATPSTASNFTVQGGGTLQATTFVLSGNTGTAGTSVAGATILQAVGASTAANGINNLGNAAGTIDPTSTFLYTGTATGANINTLTSNRTIGRLAIGDGTHASILNLATAALSVGADVTVNASSTLDLNGQNLTEGFVTGAINGGLNGSGSVQNSGAGTTATLTLDTTAGNGSFSGALRNSGTGTLALVKTGSGTQTLSGSSAYTGGTTVSGGTLKIGSAVSSTNSAIGSTSGSLTVNNGGTFDLAGFAQTVGALTLGSGGSTIANSGAAQTLTTSGVTVNGTGNTINSGVTVTGAVSASGASLADNGALSGNVTLGTGTLTGTGSVGGMTGVTGGTINGTGMSLGGLVTFNSGGGSNTLSGTETASGGISVGSGAVLAQSGTLTGSVSNAGSSTFSGTIVGSGSSFSNSGGTALLSSANSYGGGTTITGGKVVVNGGASGVNSGTGSGAVTVSNSGSVLAGNGTISGAVTVGAGTSLYSGGVATGTPSTGAGSGLTLNSSLGVNSANLTFALSAGNVSDATFSNPNTSTSYLSTTSTVNFTGSDSITLVDLTNGQLSLRMNQPYLLITSSLGDAGFSGLVIRGSNGQLSQGGDGYVVGVYVSGSNGSYVYNPITFSDLAADGVSALASATTADPGYYEPELYLSNGDLEVVPEPGTWALMIGGLGVLVLCQRRRAQNRPEQG